MAPRYALLAVSLVVAAFCTRLGFWQLARHRQKVSWNSAIAARMAEPPADVRHLGSDTGVVRGRRVRASGRFDYSREYAHAHHSYQGSPGVHLVTPLVRDGTDTLVLVVRGWVYAPDAATADFGRWRERDSVSLEGYALPFAAGQAGADSIARAPRALLRLERANLERRMAQPLAGYYLVMTSGAMKADSVPNRLSAPVLTDGPHISYAVQWFLFAATFGVGGAFVVLRGRSATGGSQR